MKKKYTRKDAFLFLLRDGWKYSKKMMLLLLTEGIVNGLSNMSGSVLTAGVIYILSSVKSMQEMLLQLTMLFALYGLIQVSGTFLKNRNVYQYIAWRGRFFQIVMDRAIATDYATYEKDEVKAAYQHCMEGIGGNQLGMEGFMHHITIVISCLIQLGICFILISNISLLLIIVLLAIALTSYFLHQKFHDGYMKTLDPKAENEIHLNYFARMPFLQKSGKDIRIYQMQKLLNPLFDHYHKQQIILEGKSEKYRFYANLTTIIIDFLKDLVGYGYLLYLVLYQNMNVSAFVLYLGVISTFSQQFISFSDMVSTTQQDLDLTAKLLNCFEMFETKDGTAHFQANALDIVFDHVSFQYPGSERMILDDFNLHIQPGEKIALVGLNGAGKTTIVKLLCRFYHPTKGRILVNGIDIETVQIKDYLKTIGVLFQDTGLFSFTIGENISGLVEGSYDEERVNAALAQADMQDVISRLKDGVHTYVNKEIDEQGVFFSGGEMQKLLLARVIYHQPKFMILDEPTAALDAISEQHLYQKYSALIGNHNALFISHRLASTRFCDRIILLEDGKIVEEGDHTTLMHLHGRYAHLFEVQSQYYQEGDDHETAAA